MSEKLHGHESEAGHGTWNWPAEADERLTWLRPKYGRAPIEEALWLPSLDRKLVDFHARYERACTED